MKAFIIGVIMLVLGFTIGYLAAAPDFSDVDELDMNITTPTTIPKSDEDPTPTPTTTTTPNQISGEFHYTNTDANMIVVDSPTPSSTIENPVTITGKARGGWFFEATFPVVIVDWDGRIIGEGQATAQDEWMTEEFVPFTAEVEYTLEEESSGSNRGAIILRNANASGLPENDAAVEYTVYFE